MLNVARKSAELFAERSAAISAGYRRVGMDFPSMGEHWVNPRLVFEGKFDAARPAMLTYSVVNGNAVLLGVVFAIPLDPGQQPPAHFGSDAIWHEHNGSLAEESMLPEHHTASPSGAAVRLAILHAWVRAPNPDGVFAAENWALPFIRLGLSVPPGFPKGAARAVSLLSGGERYFLELGRDSSGLLAHSLNACAEAAQTIVSRARSRGGVLTAAEIHRLDEAWTAEVAKVAASAGDDVAKRINGGVLPKDEARH
ncbi:MAG: hypothetical protein ABIW94_10235 [Gemmatimonadaceae bacterium]